MEEILKSVDKEYIKKFRKNFGLTQSELAAYLDVSKKTVESWESSDKNISGPTAVFMNMINEHPELMDAKKKVENSKSKANLIYDFIDFGCSLFDDGMIRSSLQKKDYIQYRKAYEHKEALSLETAEKIAEAMKNWALKKGCTHYTHWFHPLTGSTAEKHNSFLEEENGRAILKFSGKSLIKDEPDASSFPSGGLRATFEARGYTYWDINSPAFIRGHVLYIPTVFVSYTGESLDTKGPLLKSIEAVDRAATKIVNLLGDKNVKRTEACTGLEQEFFLIDKKIYTKRRDLFLSGKTLFGAMPSKGQDGESHYFGSIPKRVNDFMEDVNAQLWDLGIYIKNEHNETAPGQFEMSPIFSSQNIAIDQNMVMMDILQKTALRHDLVCILHEAPFKGVNGSGKHNNYSLRTDDGQNLFDPGKYPEENIRFMLMISAMMRAADEYGDMIRLSSGDSGNDYRLGANEAPPAIVSVYLGEAIENLFASLSKKTTEEKKKGKEYEYFSKIISNLPRDNSDRNRTSPIAFTGNKFEFRMLGASLNPSFLNTVINTALAEGLNEYYEKLKDCKSQESINKAALEIIKENYKKHQRILYDGNGYSDAWRELAKERGLENIPTFYEAIPVFEREKNVKLFEKYGIYTKREINARCEIMYESYANVRRIEAKTLTSVTYRELIPAAVKELKFVTDVKEEYMSKAMKAKGYKLKSFIDESSRLAGELEDVINEIDEKKSNKEKGEIILKKAIPINNLLRENIDAQEHYISKDNMPCPGYEELFFNLDK